MGRLLINHPPPYQLESITSYIARLALTNYYPSPSWIEGLMKQRIQYAKVDARADQHILEELSELCGKAPDQLALTTIHGRFAEALTSQESDVPAKSPGLFRVDKDRKVCPVCLTEGKHLQIPWLVRSVTACPKHHCLLVDTCSCGRRLRYPDVMDVCVCGVSTESAAVTPVSEEGLSHTRYVLGLLGLERHGSGIDLIGPISELDPKGFLVLLECLRRWLAGFSIDSSNSHASEVGLSNWKRPKRFLTAVSNRADHVLYATAFSVLREWPAQFHRLLAKQREAVGSRSLRHSSGIYAEFPVLVSLMARYLPSSRYQFLYDAFHHYLGSEWDGGHVARISSLSADKVEAARQRFVGQWDAATLLGVDITRVKELVASGSLSARVWESRGKQNMLIRRQDCLELLDRWTRSLSEDEACARLALTHSSLHALVDADILETIQNPRHKLGRQFDPAVLESLISRMQGLSRSLVSRQFGKWTALNEPGPSLCYLLRDIFAGRVRIREVEGQGLSRFQFSAEDVQRIRSAARQADMGYTRKEAAEELGMPLVLLRKAIDTGLLTLRQDGLRGQFISRTDLESFKDMYVDFHQALRLLGAAQVTLKRWLRKRILVPVISTDRKFRKHLFRKADIQALKEDHVPKPATQPYDSTPASRRAAGRRRKAPEAPTLDSSPDTLISTAQACLVLKASPAWLAKQTRNGLIGPVSGPKINGEKGNTFRLGDVALLAQTCPPKQKTLQGRAPTNTLNPVTSESTPDQLLSAAEAAKILGVSQSWLRTMAWEGRIPIARQEWPSGYVYFDKGEIRKMVPRHLSVSSSEAAKMLGIPDHALHRWRERGLITPVEGPEINGQGRYRYGRADVEALMANRPRQRRGYKDMEP